MYSALVELILIVLVFLLSLIMNSGAERFNGLMAIIGIVAGVGAYATTGQFIPGIFRLHKLKKIVNRFYIY